MTVANVTVTRLGNKYLKEYVEYYKSIGYDKMYFYDNNHDDEEKVIEVLQEYVESGFVEIIPFNVIGRIQEKAYQHFYDNYSKEYDWYSLFDDDEYVTIVGCKSIKEFLEREMFSDKNGIAFPMINFCDSDVIVNDKNTRLDVYTEVMNPNNLFHNSYYKSIVRGGLNIRYENATINGGKKYNQSCHIPEIDGVIGKGMVDCDGHEVLHEELAFITRYAVKSAFLKHIPTGCIDDYINTKVKRGWPDTDSDMNNKFDLKYFFTYNNPTKEKVEYYIEHIK